MKGLKVPLLLGVIPLVIEVLILLLWLVTGWHWLPIAGAATLVGGLISVIVGMSWLGVCIVRTARSGKWSRRSMIKSTVLTASILLVNFPAAAVIIWAAFKIETAYTMVVRNLGSTPIESAAITGGGLSLDLRRIDPGARVTRTFHVTRQEGLVFSGGRNGQKIRFRILGYVSKDGGECDEIDIFPDGRVEVRVRRRRYTGVLLTEHTNAYPKISVK